MTLSTASHTPATALTLDRYQLRKANEGMVYKEDLEAATDRAINLDAEAKRLKAAAHTMVPRRELELAQTEAETLQDQLRLLKSKLNATVNALECGLSLNVPAQHSKRDAFREANAAF